MMEIQYYVLDLETSGTKCGYHEVTQISVIRCSDRKQLSRYVAAQHPKRANPQALKITGRSIHDIVQGETKSDIIKLVDDFFAEDGCTPEARCIIGHNIIKFDQKFLHHMWGKEGKKFPANLWLDTIEYFKKYKEKYGIDGRKTNLKYALETVGGKSRGTAHNAIVDTQENYILWYKLKEEIPFRLLIKRAEHKVDD